MPDIVLDLRYLRCALAAAEFGSFRLAAASMNLPQSTVSRRIQLLEGRIGAAIFERSHSGVRLTHAGEKFIREAAFGAGHLQQAVADIGLVQRGVSGGLRIGVTGSLASGFLADLFTCFRNRFPEVELKLDETSSQSNAAGVLSGRLDAAFISGAPQLPGCEARQLWEESIFLALPSHHRFAHRVRVSWQEIREESFIVGADGPGPEMEDYLIKQLSDLGFRPRIVAQRVGRENLLNMVASGFGITLATDSTLGTSYRGVVFVPVGNDDESVVSSVIWSSNIQNAALRRMLELCELLRDNHVRRA